MTFKPLLAGKAPADLSMLAYPVMASPKLDGIRCVKLDGRALSRTLKPIPNPFVRSFIETLPDGLDGEIMLLNLAAPFSEVTSAVMNTKGEPKFVYAVFDNFLTEGPFFHRYAQLETWIQHNNPDNAKLMIVPHTIVHGEDSLRRLMAIHLEQGFEGTMIRSPQGRYKQGRSTDREGILLKIKAFEDEEAMIMGVEEEQANGNVAYKDEVGRTKRSTAQAGKTGKGRLGALICKTAGADAVEFNIGTGFNEEQRIELWKRRDVLPGMLVKFKHQPPPGGRKVGEAPRFPVFLGFRSAEDM